MAVAAPTGPFIQAAGYRQGRAFNEAKAVSWIQIHSAEGSTEEIGLGNFFAHETGGSSHAGIGQGGGFAEYVRYSDTAWTGPRLNEESDTFELCGFSRWSRDEWLAHDKMLGTAAQAVAWRSAVRQIPIVHRSSADILHGLPGVPGHVDITEAYHDSDHMDPGPNFPWDVFLADARNRAGLVPKPAGPPMVLVFNKCKGDPQGRGHVIHSGAGMDAPWDGKAVKPWCPKGTTLRPGARGQAVTELEKGLGLAPTGYWGYPGLTDAAIGRKHGQGFATSPSAPRALRQGCPEVGWELAACL